MGISKRQGRRLDGPGNFLIELHLRGSDRGERGRELRRARDYLIGQLELALESTENQMHWVAEQLLGFDKIIPPDQIKDRLHEVRPSDLRRAAQDFFQPDRLCLSLVSPLKNSRHLRKWLEF